MVVKGSCLCGGVTYEVDNNLKATMNCHCQFCRKAHAAPYVTSTLIPSKDLTIVTGEQLITKYQVDEARTRCFCSACGTRLFNDTGMPGYITVMVATFERPELVAPMGHVNVESKLTTLVLNDGLPTYATFPPAEQIQKLLAD
jgi:hypothetical protein